MDKISSLRRKIANLLPLPKQEQAGFFAKKSHILIAGLLVVAVLFVPAAADATVGDIVARAVGALFNFLTMMMGQLLLLLIGALIYIAQYNGFVNSAAVTNGWVIVRDVANMFFIIALLIIAFGTMIWGESGSYHYSRTLPRLVIMAILVNFSRTICGLIIDFSQIVMLTFVNGFKEAAGGNFVNAFQIQAMMEQGATNQSGENILWHTAVAIILAFILITISAGVVIVMITVLVVRIVYLWLLVVLSPLAFLASAVPLSRASQFYGRWWDNFNKQVIVGPLMAFFLWLSLVSVSTDSFHTDGFPTREDGQAAVTSESIDQDVSGALQSAVIEKFIIGIALMLGGVALAQEMSGGAVSAGKSIAKRAGRAGVAAGKFVGRQGKKGFMAAGGELAVNRVKTGALSLGTRIPLLRGSAGEALGKHRAEEASKVKAAESWMANLKPEERKRFKGGIATNPAARARQLAAHKVDLERAGKGWDTGMNASDFNKSMKEAKRLGGMMNVDTAKLLIDAKGNSPKLLVDPNSTGQEHDDQVKSLNTVARAKRAKWYEDSNKNQIDGNVLARGNAQEIAKAIKTSHGKESGNIMEGFAGTTYDAELKAVQDSDTTGKLSDFEARARALSNLEAKVTAKQQEFKNDPANFNVLSSSEQAAVVQKAEQQQLNGLSNERLSSLYGQLDSSGKVQMANKLVELDSDKIKDLPDDMAQAIRRAMKDSSQILASGGNIDEAFKGFNSSTSNFSDAAGREQYSKWVNSGSLPERSEKLSRITPIEMERNQHANDLNIEIVSGLSAKDITQMANSGDASQVEKLVGMLNRLEGVDVTKAISDYEDSLPADLDGSKAASMKAGFEERLKLAVENASKIMNDLSASKTTVSQMLAANRAQQKIAQANARQEKRFLSKFSTDKE